MQSVWAISATSLALLAMAAAGGALAAIQIARPESRTEVTVDALAANITAAVEVVAARAVAEATHEAQEQGLDREGARSFVQTRVTKRLADVIAGVIAASGVTPPVAEAALALAAETLVRSIVMEASGAGDALSAAVALVASAISAAAPATGTTSATGTGVFRAARGGVAGGPPNPVVVVYRQT